MLKKLMRLWKWRRQVRSALGSLTSLYEGDGVADALGGLTAEETAGLVGWLPKSGTVIEFGTLFGLTTIELARRAAPDVKIVTVDIFCWNPFGLPPDKHEQFTRRILAPWIESGKVELVRADSREFRAALKEVPSLVFFDADHRYEAVKDEIAWAKSIGVPTICGHDYGNRLFGVTCAVDEAFPGGVETAGMCWKAEGKSV